MDSGFELPQKLPPGEKPEFQNGDVFFLADGDKPGVFYF
jgi:hypothetical protein